MLQNKTLRKNSKLPFLNRYFSPHWFTRICFIIFLVYIVLKGHHNKMNHVNILFSSKIVSRTGQKYDKNSSGTIMVSGIRQNTKGLNIIFMCVIHSGMKCYMWLGCTMIMHTLYFSKQLHSQFCVPMLFKAKTTALGFFILCIVRTKQLQK